MNKPKIVGEGTYGCVHKPALKCKNKIAKPNINSGPIIQFKTIDTVIIFVFLNTIGSSA